MHDQKQEPHTKMWGISKKIYNEMVVDDVRGVPTEVIFSTLVLLVQVYSLPCMFRSVSYVSVWCDAVVEASCCSRELLPQV